MKPQKLSREELWQRVKGLEGRPVYTLKQKRRNLIESVLEDRITISGRKSEPTRAEVETVYDNLWANGQFRLGEQDWSGSSNWIWRVVPAIVLAALPDQVERIEDDGLSGIRLKDPK